MQIVAKYNSGTCAFPAALVVVLLWVALKSLLIFNADNNQFIVLDTRRVALSAGAAVLLKDSLWIIEQMPLAVQSQARTRVCARAVLLRPCGT